MQARLRPDRLRARIRHAALHAGRRPPRQHAAADGRRQARRRRRDADVSDLGPRLARRVFRAAARRHRVPHAARRAREHRQSQRPRLPGIEPEARRRLTEYRAAGHAHVQGDDGGRRRGCAAGAAGAIVARRLSQLRDRRRARPARRERHAGAALRVERSRLRAPLDLRERRRLVSAEADAQQGRHADSADAGTRRRASCASRRPRTSRRATSAC